MTLKRAIIGLVAITIIFIGAMLVNAQQRVPVPAPKQPTIEERLTTLANQKVYWELVQEKAQAQLDLSTLRLEIINNTIRGIQEQVAAAQAKARTQAAAEKSSKLQDAPKAPPIAPEEAPADEGNKKLP